MRGPLRSGNKITLVHGERHISRHRVAVVGLGTMGLRHVRVLLGLETRFELVGGFDLRSEAATPEGVVRLDSEAEAFARADVVVVATPIDAHAGVVGRALAAGRHVFVEKPVCATSEEARAAVARARGGARLFVGHSERFNPVIRALARIVSHADVVAMDLRRVGPTKPCGHGVLVNLGVHDLDLASYLGGGDVVVRGALGGDDLAHVLFSIGSGAVGHMLVDRTGATKERVIHLSTDRWTYRGDLLEHRLVRTPRAGTAPVGTFGPTPLPLPLDEPLVVQAEALADALDGKPVREIATGLDGLRALELAELAGLRCAENARAAPAENLSVDARR